MPKFFHLVALLLSVAVPGGGQCADVCSFLALHRVDDTANLPPCHRTQQKQSPDPACAHHDIVAEQQVAKALDSSPEIVLAATALHAQAPVLDETAVPTVSSSRPPPHRPPALSILRI